MLRILHVMGCSDAGGISTVVRNYYQFMDRSRIHFDIALTVPEQGQNSRALEALGAHIFFLPMKSHDMEGFRLGLQKLLSEGHYDGIHVHEGETSFVALRIAYQMGIPCRIAHAHTTSPYEGIGSVFRRWAGCILNYRYATHVVGCGQLAGERIFGKNNMKRERAVVLPNAVDVQKFAFDPQVRTETRRRLGVEQKFVLGMVARLSDQKNIPFAVELMDLMREQLPEAVLLIVGNGENEQKIRDQIRNLHLEQQVRLLGRQASVEDMYQAFDLLLMPSLYEGYPLAAVEALSSGLPVVMSDKITRELQFSTGVSYLSLRDREAWIRTISGWKQDEFREQRQAEIPAHGLDIRDCVGLLQRIYEEDAAIKPTQNEK